MATSPSATAFLLSQFFDWRSRYSQNAAYLEDLLRRQEGGLPMAAPYRIFLRVWMLCYLGYGGLLAEHANSLKPYYRYLREHWRFSLQAPAKNFSAEQR